MKQLALLVVLLVVVAGAAQAADWYELQYNMDSGHQSYYKMTMDMEARIQALGTELPPMLLQMEQLMSQEVVSVEDDEFTVTFEQKPVKLMLNNKAQQLPNMSKDIPKMFIVYDKYGDLKKTYSLKDGQQQGPDVVIKEQLTKLMGGQLPETLDGFLSQLTGQIQRFIKADMPELPKEAVQVGYKWYSYFQSQAGEPVTLNMVTENTLMQASDTACTIQTVSKADFALSAPVPMPDGSTSKMAIAGTFTAAMWSERDVLTGELISMTTLPGAPLQINLTASGNIPLGPGGQAQPIDATVAVTGKLSMLPTEAFTLAD